MDPRNHPQISNRIPVQNFSPMHQQPTSPIGPISMPIPQFEMSSMHVQNIQQHTQNMQQQQQQHSQNMGSAVPGPVEPPRSALGLGHVSIDMRRNNSSNNSDDSDANDEINQYVVEALFPLIDDLCVLTKSVGRFGVKLMSMNIFDKSKFDDIMDDRDDYARVYKLYNGALRVNAGRKLVEALLTSDNYNVIQFIKENVMEPNVLMEMERVEQHLVDTLRLNFNQHMGHHSASSSAETSAAATLLLLESRGGSSGVNVNVNSHSHSAQNNHPTLNTELTRGSYDELLQQSLGSAESTGENNMPPRNNVPFSATVAALFPIQIGPSAPLSSAESTGGDNSEKVKHKRRKKAAPDEWERAKNKKLRMQGLEYMGYKKCKDGGVEKNILIVRKKRQIGPPCSSRKCSAGSYTSCSKFTDESRQNIFQNFWTRMNWEQRKTYVSSLVDVVKIKRSTVQGHESRRSSSLRYMLKLNGEKKRVCKQMFLSTLGIGSHSVHSWILKPDGPGSGSGSGSSSSFLGLGMVGTGRSPKKSQLSSMSVTLTSASTSKPVKTKKAKATTGAAGPGLAAEGIATNVTIKTEPTFTSTISSMVPTGSPEVNSATGAATITNLTSVSSVSIEPLPTQQVALAEPTPTHTVTGITAALTTSTSVDSNSNISTINSNSNISASSPLADDNDNEVDDENDNDQLDDQSDDPAAASSSTTGGNIVDGSSSLNPGAHFLVKDYFDSLVKMPQEYLSIVHE